MDVYHVLLTSAVSTAEGGSEETGLWPASCVTICCCQYPLFFVYRGAHVPVMIRDGKKLITMHCVHIGGLDQTFLSAD